MYIQVVFSLLDLFFPKKCVGCKKINSYFCIDCILKIKQADLICPLCERLSWQGVTHPNCREKYGLDGLWSLGSYQDPLKKGIQKLKYKGIIDLAGVLVDLIIETWAKDKTFYLNNNYLITPVPLHSSRQNWRGFNQSALIGKLLAQKLNLNYQEILKRVKKTKPQVSLKGGDRKQNIKGAFILKPLTTLLANEQIILIDDVWTTGSTVKECCYILKKAGVKSVWSITLAR